MSWELKPCPFCGGEAELVSSTSSMVQCQNDQCIIGDPAPFNDFSHRADAIAAWNRRTSAIDMTAMAERFCATPLPDSVCADLCATHQGPGRYGTHLLTVAQAKEMLTAVLSTTPTEDARSRVKVLEEALEAIRDGDVPRPVAVRWRADGKPSRLDQCKHGVTMNEDCAGCINEFVDTALGNKETDRHG